jgi:hypothetical protein
MRSDCRLSFVDTIRSEHVAVLDEAASAVRRRHALPVQRPFAGYRASFDPGRVFSKTLKKLRIIMEEKVNELCEKTRVSIRDVQLSPDEFCASSSFIILTFTSP